MVQILTVKYTKEEERIVMISNVSGILIGIPIGLFLSYLIGFFTDLTSAAFSSIGWTMLMLKIGSIIIPMCWATTIAICFLLCKKKNELRSTEKIWRMILGTLFLPLTLALGFLVMALIIFPLCFLVFDFVNRPITAMIIGTLALIPFAILIIALLLPETPAGKTLRRYVRRLEKRGKKEREY